MSEEVVPLETAFVVYIHSDGTATATGEFSSEPLTMNRIATIADIERASELVLKEVREANFAARVAANIAAMFMAPPEETPAAAVSEALSKRGIHPESPSDTP